jgi:cytochrome c553
LSAAPAVAALLLAACDRAPPPPPAPLTGFEQPATTDQAALRRHGERLAQVLGCRGCHGDDFTGEDWSDPGFSTQHSSNLTRAMARYSDTQFIRIVREGRRPDGSALWEMPSAIFAHVSNGDLRAVAAYLRTLPAAGVDHPQLVIHARGRRAVAAGEWRSSPDQVEDERGRGPARLDGRHEAARYMVRATCGECHGVTLAGRASARGQVPDLIVAAGYTREQFRHLMRTGEAPGGRRLRLMDQVARGRFAYLTPREVDAIHDYLIARAARPQ